MEGEPNESNSKSEPLLDSAPCRPPSNDRQSERTVSPLISPLDNSHDNGSNLGNVHDGETNDWEDPTQGDDGQTCKVCGDNSVGSLFSSVVCVPCKTFFLRYGSDHQTFKCKYGGNCTITPLNRTRCKYCRYQSCNAVGMWKKVRPAEVQVREGQQACVVCCDIANGVHFGAITCEGCKKFFRRGLIEHDSYSCKNDKKCPINPQTRNSCRYCRYQKCLVAGMSREAIQMGRPSKTRTEALKFLRVNNNKQHRNQTPKKRNSSNSNDVIDEPEVDDDEEFESLVDGGFMAVKRYKSSTTGNNENPTQPRPSLHTGFEPNQTATVPTLHEVFYKRSTDEQGSWDGIQEDEMKYSCHADGSSASRSFEKLHAVDSSVASRDDESRGQQPANGMRTHANGVKREEINDFSRNKINNFRFSDGMYWMNSSRLQIPEYSYKADVRPSTHLRLQSGFESNARNYGDGPFPLSSIHAPHNGAMGFAPQRPEEYYFGQQFHRQHLNGGNYHQNHNPYYSQNNYSNKSAQNNRHNNTNNKHDNNDTNTNNKLTRSSISSSSRKNDDSYEVPGQGLDSSIPGGANSAAAYEATRLSRLSPDGRERPLCADRGEKSEMAFHSKIVENQLESHSREYFLGKILGPSHPKSSSSSVQSLSSLSHMDIHVSRVTSGNPRSSRLKFTQSDSSTSNLCRQQQHLQPSPSISGDRSSPYSSVMMLLNNCQLFNEACKNPFHLRPTHETAPHAAVRESPSQPAVLPNSSLEEYPRAEDDSKGDQGRNAKIIRLLDSPEQLRITESYWLKHDELPDESLMLNDKHFDVIHQIVSAYEKFLQCGTNINITLKKELESWNLHSQVPLQGSISLPEWIQVKVIPVYTYTSITYCKSLPGFLDLPLNDQATLIRLGQTQSRIMLAAIHWFDPQKKNFEDFLSWRPLDLFKQRLIAYADKMQTLQLDFIESALLNALIVIAADYPGLENPVLINHLRQRILLPFRAYTTAKFGTPNHRLEHLFKHIPETRQLGFLHYKMTMRASLRAEEVEKQGD